MKNFLIILATTFLLCSCATKKDIQYLQDLSPNSIENISPNTGITIEPNDLLSIVVSTKDPELGEIFNIQPGNATGGQSQNQANQSNIDRGYRVDNDGNIIFPVLGTIHVTGLNRVELENLIKNRIIKEGLLKEFAVRVSFLNFKVSVLGDAGSIGNYTIEDDKYNLLQLLAEAGGTNVTAEIEEVLVIREKGGKRMVYQVNLKTKELFNSPAYYLQQNDIVYIIPNDKKAEGRDTNSSTFRSFTFWMSMFSFAGSIATMIIALTKD